MGKFVEYMHAVMGPEVEEESDAPGNVTANMATHQLLNVVDKKKKQQEEGKEEE